MDLGAAPTRSAHRGDAILVSGTLGDHGVALLSVRGGLALDGVESDTAPLDAICRAVLHACPAVHAMRDATRGGVASVVAEIATRRQLGMRLVAGRAADARSGARRLRASGPRPAAHRERGQGRRVRALEARRPSRCALARRCARIRSAATPRASAAWSPTSDRGLVTVLQNALGGDRVLELLRTNLLEAAAADLLKGDRHGEDRRREGLRRMLWISEGLSCDGDTVSITAASQPALEDVVLGLIPGLPKVHLHNKCLAYETGEDFT